MVQVMSYAPNDGIMPKRRRKWNISQQRWAILSTIDHYRYKFLLSLSIRIIFSKSIVIDSRKTLEIWKILQIRTKISTFELRNPLKELCCKAVTQNQTLKCSLTIPWFDCRSCFWSPLSSTPMKPKTRQVVIFVQLFLQLKIALYWFKLLSITIDHYRQKKSLSLSLSVKISLSLIPAAS